MKKPPKILDRIVDVVLKHTPTLRTKQAKKRRRKTLRALRKSKI